VGITANTKTMNKAGIFRAMDYYPHAKQAAVHASKARFRIVAAGARAGKSMLAGAEIVCRLLLPDQRIWCVSTQYTLAEKEFDWALQFLDRLKIGRHKALRLAHVSNQQRGSKKISFPWGSFCETKSCEKPQLLLGEELDLIVLCEASQIPRSIWHRQLRARIGPRNGGLLATSTPNADGGLFWEFFQIAENTPDWERWQFNTIANPTFSKKEWEIAKTELDEKVFAEQYEGRFVSRRGQVFSMSDGNFIDSCFSSFSLLPVLVGVHYRPNNPVAVVFIAVQHEPRRYIVFDEIYDENLTAIDVIPSIKEKMQGFPKFLGVFVDFWDFAIQKEFRQAGLEVGVNRKEKEIGKKLAAMRRIQGLQNALKIREDGQSKLLLHTRCTKTIRDFERCKWPDKRKEEAEVQEKELPLTKYMFAPHAVSYVIAFCENAVGVDFYRVAN